jgi:hypothetical protein
MLFLVGCGGSAATMEGTPQPIFLTPTPTSTPTPLPTAVPLPNDIVVYPGAQLVVSQPITTGTLYFYRSSAALQAVTTFYMEQMPQKGWTQTSAQLNGTQGNFLVYMKGSRSVKLNIVPDPLTQAQTDITVTASTP